MTQGWIVSLYVDCIQDIGLHCPNATAIEQFEEAVQEGWITWHTFPHNAQLSVMNREMVEFGVDLVHSLDQRYAKAKKTVLSQRDVPGLPRPILNLVYSGLKALSVGSNS